MPLRLSRNLLPVLLVLACEACAASRSTSHVVPQAGSTDALDHQTADSLFRRGRESADRGDTVRAEQYLQLALDKGYDRSRALPVLLGVCLSSGRLRSALNYAEPELRLRPDDAHLRYLVASIHLGLGQKAEAREELEQLVRANPPQPAALYLLGVIEVDEFGEDRAAQEYFQMYLSAAPQGKHAPEIRNRLSGLDARQDSSRTPSAPDEGRMPRYELYVPTPRIMIAPVAAPPAARPEDGEEGGWR